LYLFLLFFVHRNTLSVVLIEKKKFDFTKSVTAIRDRGIDFIIPGWDQLKKNPKSKSGAGGMLNNITTSSRIPIPGSAIRLLDIIMLFIVVTILVRHLKVLFILYWVLCILPRCLLAALTYLPS
jgi:hypothetical protein